jgi:hypothetical protein
MPPFDLLLSYRTHHAARVAALISALERAGLRVWHDRAQLRPAHAITPSLRQALAATRVLAVYATPDYAQSHICAWELASAWIAAERAGLAPQRILLLKPTDLTWANHPTGPHR